MCFEAKRQRLVCGGSPLPLQDTPVQAHKRRKECCPCAEQTARTRKVSGLSAPQDARYSRQRV